MSLIPIAFFAFMYITMCLHCYNHIVSPPPFIFVNGLIVERKIVNDPYRLLLRANPVTPSQFLSGAYMDK